MMEQQVDHAEQVLTLFLFLCLFLYLYHAVEEKGVQPAAVPNEEEDVDTEEQVVEQEKDHHHSHLENQDEKWVVAVQAGPCGSSKHDVECDGEQDYLKSAVHIHCAVQLFRSSEEHWVECCPCMEFGHQNPTNQKKRIWDIHDNPQPRRRGALLQQQRCGALERSSDIGGNSIS